MIGYAGDPPRDTDILRQNIGHIFKGQAVQDCLYCLTFEDGPDILLTESYHLFIFHILCKFSVSRNICLSGTTLSIFEHSVMEKSASISDLSHWPRRPKP